MKNSLPTSAPIIPEDSVFLRHYRRIFTTVAFVTISLCLGLVILIFHLVDNYEKYNKILYVCLVMQRNYIDLACSMKNAELSALDYIQTGNPASKESWSFNVNSAKTCLAKFEYDEKDEPDDLLVVQSIRSNFEQWQSEQREYFHNADTLRAGGKPVKISLQSAEIPDSLWKKLTGIFAKEEIDQKSWKEKLRQSQNNLWSALVILILCLSAALTAMLYVLRQYFNRIAENHKILQENESRYRAIVEDQTEFICRFKPNRTYIFANDVYCRFFGVQKEILHGSNWHPVVYPDDLEHVQKELSKLSVEHPVIVVENRVINADKKVRWAQFVNRAFFDENKNIIEVQSVGRDITELKNVQERLESANALLEGRVKERTRELENALEKAQTTQHTKEKFLAIMSHEMRTPLQSIIGFTEMTLGSTLTKEQRRYLENIRSQNETLLKLINDILDFSQLESNNLTLERTPFNLHQLVQTVVSGLQPLADAKNLKLSFYIHTATPTYVLGDSLRVRQILVNLIGNAIKFTHSGSVTLGVKPSLESSNPEEGKTSLITFEATDTGLGIPKSKIPTIFKMYSRIESSGRPSVDGTGLGLSICKLLCDLMNGKIWVESTEGKGSTFFVEIPLINTKPVDHPVLNPPSWKDSSIPTLSILVVEDNVMASTLICDFLFKMGFWPDHCASAKDAIHQVISHSYDLIFMDLNLPDLTGDVVTSTIRSNTTLLRQPIIIGLSASVLKEDRERCLASGMNDFALKPITQAELNSIICKWSTAIPEKKSYSLIDSTTQASFKELSSRTGKDTWQIITQTFLDETPDILKRMRESCDKLDRAQLRHLAHYLQGGADILGARAISDLCVAILDSAKTSVTEESKKLVSQLESDAKTLLQDLSK